MTSNLCELTSVTLDKDSLNVECLNYLNDNSGDINNYRINIEFDRLSRSLKELALKIYDTIRVEPKNYLIQVSDMHLFKHKKFLDIVHKDVDRQSCITIPIKYNIMEPIMFYDDIPDIQPEEYRKLGKPWPAKPVQILNYSQKHPTLVNLQKLHSVRIIDNTSPRILFQLSYDIPYFDIIDINPSVWSKI